MDKLLRPDRFEGSRDTTPAEWSHWSCTFNNFQESVGGDPAPDKLKLLINHISPSVYNHIIDCKNYDEAINVLKSVYVKPPNEIFARHQLATRKQAGSESVDQFLQSLKSLAKDCGFKSVTADTYKQEAVRDAFITGLSSPAIRQRLLEKSTFTLLEAVQLTVSLESAQRNAEMYLTPVQHGYVSSALSDSPGDLSTENPVQQPGSDTTAFATRAACYFCGNSKHPRPRCPTRNVYCMKCGKRGHFAKVCKAVDLGKQSNRTSVAVSAAALHIRDSSNNYVAEDLHRHRMMNSTAASQTVVDPPHRAKIDVRINNVIMTALIDSGSTSSVIEQLCIPVAHFKENII